jgi:hypothetical protein
MLTGDTYIEGCFLLFHRYKVLSILFGANVKHIWVVTCEGNPVGAYSEEAEANLFAIRASGLMQISGFKVTQVILYGDQLTDESADEQTVFTVPAMPESISPGC